jgi:hypothetical protein
MATPNAAFADLLVDYEERRIDENPSIRRPSARAVDNFFNAAAKDNAALASWVNYRAGDDHEADAIRGISRGQSHRRNMPLVAEPTPALSRHVPQPKLRVPVEEKSRTRRTADQPAVVHKPPPSKSLRSVHSYLTNTMARASSSQD